MEKPTDNREHIVSSYDQELGRLSATILEMGGLAEAELAAAIQAVAQRDDALARQTIASDLRIDALELEVDAQCTRLLALRQPMAVDLRAIMAALKLAADIERVGDYAKNVAKRSLALNQAPPVTAVHGIPRIGRMVQGMIKDVLDAYAKKDIDLAVDVWNRDQDVDRLYNSLFRELLTYMMEDPRTITSCTHLLFIAKNIERMGDYATNIAETVYFLVTGARMSEARPKGDETPTMTITPRDDEDGARAE